MTNAVYMTPHLPLKKDNTCPKTQFEESILEYFSYYSPSRTGELVSRLKKYDFSSVKAHFVASVPGKFENGVTKWGLSRLQHILKSTPASSQTELFAQVPISYPKFPRFPPFESHFLLGIVLLYRLLRQK